MLELRAIAIGLPDLSIRRCCILLQLIMTRIQASVLALVISLYPSSVLASAREFEPKILRDALLNITLDDIGKFESSRDYLPYTKATSKSMRSWFAFDYLHWYFENLENFETLDSWERRTKCENFVRVWWRVNMQLHKMDFYRGFERDACLDAFDAWKLCLYSAGPSMKQFPHQPAEFLMLTNLQYARHQALFPPLEFSSDDYYMTLKASAASLDLEKAEKIEEALLTSKAYASASNANNRARFALDYLRWYFDHCPTGKTSMDGTQKQRCEDFAHEWWQKDEKFARSKFYIGFEKDACLNAMEVWKSSTNNPSHVYRLLEPAPDFEYTESRNKVVSSGWTSVTKERFERSRKLKLGGDFFIDAADVAKSYDGAYVSHLKLFEDVSQ